MSNFKKFLALVLATLMVASVMVFTAPAASAATDDHANDIAFLGALDVFKGYSADNLGADDPILRYQMALFLARITTGITDDSFWQKGASNYFTDCNEYTFPGAIDYCAQKGYINGKGDNLFAPYDTINYQEAITMIVRLLGREKKTDVFPIDQYITAATIGLTADVDGALTKALTRKEIADLVVKAINIDVLDAEGKATGKLVNTVLKGEDLGTGTLVATWNAAIEGNDFAKYGEVTFAYGDKTVTVKLANVANKDALDINDYLGLSATLVTLNKGNATKEVTLATMRDVKIVDATATADNKVKADGIEFGTFYVYGAKKNEVFVKGTTTKGLTGKAVISDVTGNGFDKNDTARFMPYNATKAIYVAEGVTVAKNKGGWPADTTLNVYYVPHTSNSSNGTTVKTDYTYNYVAVERTVYSSALQDRLDSKVVGIANTGISGLARPDGVSVGTDKIDIRTTINTDGSVKFANTTSLYVSTVGEIKHGVVAVYGIHPVDGLTFVVAGNEVEIETGTATLTELTGTDLKIGDTSLTVGFTKANVAVNNWYDAFSDVEADAQALLGKKVDYKKVDGKIVALKEYVKPDDTPDAPAKTYLTDPFTATPLFVSIKNDAKLTVAEDGTIAIDVLDPNTLTTSTVKFDQINGKKVGALVNQFGYEVAKDILGVTASNLTGAVKELLTIDGNVFDYSATKAKNTLYLVTVANKADDVYALSTTNNAAIKHVVLGTKTLAANKDKVAADTFNGSYNLGFVAYTGSSLSDKPLYVGTFWTQTEKKTGAVAQYSFASKYLTVTKDTVINVIAKDGTKSYTDLAPVAGDYLNIVDDGALVLAFSNDLVVVVNNNLKLEEIAKFGTEVVVPTDATKGGWYTLTWTTQYVSTTAETVNGTTYYNYTFKDLYNLTTGEKETVVISSTEYYKTSGEFKDSPAANFFPNWKGSSATGVNISKTDYNVITKEDTKYKDANDKDVTDKKGTLKDTVALDLYDVYYISDAKGSEVAQSSIISWGLANGYKFAQIQASGIVSGDANTFKADKLDVKAEDGKYTFTVNGTLSSVVAINSTVLNQSKDSGGDEFNKNNGAANAHAAKLATQREIVAYKLGADGVVTVFGITADSDKGADVVTNGIADALAKAAK